MTPKGHTKETSVGGTAGENERTKVENTIAAAPTKAPPATPDALLSGENVQRHECEKVMKGQGVEAKPIEPSRKHIPAQERSPGEILAEIDAMRLRVRELKVIKLRLKKQAKQMKEALDMMQVPYSSHYLTGESVSMDVEETRGPSNVKRGPRRSLNQGQPERRP